MDGKYLNRQSVLLLAIDYDTMDVVTHLTATEETKENYTALVSSVKDCGYVIGAVVSDGCPGILALTQPRSLPPLKGTRRYPRPGITPGISRQPLLFGVPHQLCVVHMQRDVEASTRKFTKEERQRLHNLTKEILFAPTLKQAEKAKERLILEAYQNHKYTPVVKMIVRRWPLLTAHFTIRVKRRKIPRDTNTAENTISYLNSRLKTMRRIRSHSSAQAISNLIVVNYRTKPLINTKNKLKRGKGPLALAMGKNKKLDWMRFIKNHAVK